MGASSSTMPPKKYKTDMIGIDKKPQDMHHDDTSLYEDVRTISQNLAKDDKWDYDEDVELFLRQLPKVR